MTLETKQYFRRIKNTFNDEIDFMLLMTLFSDECRIWSHVL